MTNQRRNFLIISIVIVLACSIMICVALAWSFNDPQPLTANDYVKKYGGNAATYSEILGLTDCNLLQEQFNVASANNSAETPGTDPYQWTLGYMKAANNRMVEIGCDPSTQ